ncbi:MAG: hypothetical protein U9R56_03050 [candidate division Zixibacteria bacterium]|nr:hypothetical protein [candidate division Zixibacteria bacterium]
MKYINRCHFYVIMVITVCCWLSATAGPLTETKMTFRVPSDYPTIQSAIDASSDGDTVLVAPGTYEEEVNFLGKSIKLLSEEGAEATTILAPYGSRSYQLPEDFDTSIAGQDGEMYRLTALQESDPAVITMDGGSDNTTVISGFTINGRNAIRGIYGKYVSPRVSNCIIEHCYGDYDAGGMFFMKGAPVITHNIVRHNCAPITGGGIFVSLGNGYGKAIVSYNICYNNKSGNGPAISYIRGDNGIIDHNICYNNIAGEDSEIRGAIYFWATDVVVVNNTMDQNTAGLTYLSSTNCDARNNIMTNNIEWGLHERSYVGPNTNVTHDYNDIWNSGWSDYNDEADPSPHEISDDPLFGEGYTLNEGSPCIDSGDPDPAYNDPDGSRNDMGAVPYDLEPAVKLILQPDTMYAVYLDAVEPMPMSVFVGNLAGGYTVEDIDVSTVKLNATFSPATFMILASHPGFDGSVLRLSLPLFDFLNSYMVLWDITPQTYSIDGFFNDGTEFVINGDFITIGHSSGDLTGDGNVDISDLICMANYFFLGAPPPRIIETADVNGSGGPPDISDLIYIITYIFQGGPSPMHP